MLFRSAVAGNSGCQEATSDPAAPLSINPEPEATCPFTRYFEFISDNSSKFWAVNLAQCAITVRYGRIGTKGQTQTKLFADQATAARTTHRLIREKLRKGYIEKPLPPEA